MITFDQRVTLRVFSLFFKKNFANSRDLRNVEDLCDRVGNWIGTQVESEVMVGIHNGTGGASITGRLTRAEERDIVDVMANFGWGYIRTSRQEGS